MASEIAPTKCRRNTPLYCGMTFSSSFPLLSSSPLFFFLTNRHCQWDLIKSVPDGSPFLTLRSSWLKSCPDNWSSDQKCFHLSRLISGGTNSRLFQQPSHPLMFVPLVSFPPDASSWLRDSKSSVRPEGPISGQAAPSSAKWWIADCIYTHNGTRIGKGVVGSLGTKKWRKRWRERRPAAIPKRGPALGERTCCRLPEKNDLHDPITTRRGWEMEVFFFPRDPNDALIATENNEIRWWHRPYSCSITDVITSGWVLYIEERRLDYPPLASLGAHFKSVSLLEKVNLDFTRQSRPLKEIINEDPPLTLPPRHLTAPAVAERETVDGAAVPSIADDARKSIIETQSEFVGRFRTLGHQ